MIGGNGEATMAREAVVDEGTVIGSGVGADGGESTGNILLALLNEGDEFLLRCSVAMLKA